MSYYDMALDAGYRGEEAREYAAYIEQGEREAYERHLEERRQIDERQGLLHALADATDADLIGELVKRGVLRTEQAPVWIDAWHVKEGEWISRFVSNWTEPVGSVGEPS